MLKNLTQNYKTQNYKKNIIVLFSGALLLRLMVLLFYPDQNFPDAISYLAAAKKLWMHGDFELDIHMPLYVIWTAIWQNPLLIKITDCMLSSGSVVLVYLLTFRVFENKLTALIAGIISSAYPYFLFYSTSRLTENLYIFLILFAFLCLYQKQFFWASCLLTLGVLTRPTLDPFNPILIFVFSFFIHNLSLKNSLKKIGIFALTYAILMSPWWVYNYQRYGHFVRLNVGGGFGLYSGNNPLNTSGGGVSDPTQGASDLNLSLTNCQQIKDKYLEDKCLKNAAIAHIKENPTKTLKLMGVKFVRFWRLWPYTPHYQSLMHIVVSVLSYGVVLALAILGLFNLTRQQWRKLSPFILFTGYLTFVHMVLISSIRYRLPVEPFLIMLAAFFVSQHLACFCERRHGGAGETA